MKYINGSELVNKRFIKLENGDYREVPKGKFIPKIGECYYCLECFSNVRCLQNEGRDADKWLFKHHLVFRTREECEDYRHFLETLNQYTFEPNWEDPSQERWMPFFNHAEHHVYIMRIYAIQYADAVCFESEKKLMAFIALVGEEAVERYMFDYWR